MKYRITIEGGFTGIPQFYEGEIAVKAKEAKKLFSALESPQNAANPDLRDAFLYRFQFIGEGKAARGMYDDSNLPEVLRTFLDTIRNDR